MGRAPCCDKANVKKGPWSPEEDTKLKDYIHKFGTGGNWIALPNKAGLKRCGKSCRLRWLNYLRPNLKHGEFSHEEDTLILNLFANIGSRWSIIASQLPGRTDNDIKNYWNTKLKKKLMSMMMIPPQFHQPQFPSSYSSSTYNYNYQNSSPLLMSSPVSSSSFYRDNLYTSSIIIDPTKPLTTGLDQTTAPEIMFHSQEGSSVIPLLIQGSSSSSSSSRKLDHHQTLNVFSDATIKQEIMSSTDIDYYQISNGFEQSQTPNNQYYWQQGSALLANDHLEDVKRLIAESSSCNSASQENHSNFFCPVIDEQSRLQDNKSMYYY